MKNLLLSLLFLVTLSGCIDRPLYPEEVEKLKTDNVQLKAQIAELQVSLEHKESMLYDSKESQRKAVAWYKFCDQVGPALLGICVYEDHTEWALGEAYHNTTGIEPSGFWLLVYYLLLSLFALIPVSLIMVWKFVSRGKGQVDVVEKVVKVVDRDLVEKLDSELEKASLKINKLEGQLHRKTQRADFLKRELDWLKKLVEQPKHAQKPEQKRAEKPKQKKAQNPKKKESLLRENFGMPGKS